MKGYEAYLIRVSGIVTGVGFRYSTKNFVSGFSNIKGYVKNLHEGEVEIVIQGKKEPLEVILSWLKKGPSCSRIDEIKINPLPLSENLPYFTIK